MDLSTTYMGFELTQPMFPGASPMVDSVDVVRRLEDAGAPLIVMHSLFEEQIVQEQLGINRAIDEPQGSFAEALSYFPDSPDFVLGPDEYLEQVRYLKDAVSVPIIASLNGTTEGGWLDYAMHIEQAGADGLELNLYELATDLYEDGATTEQRELYVVQAVKGAVSIPVAVKLSPFYSSAANFVKKLDDLQVDAVVLFNRFFQPDIDIEQLEVTRVNMFSPDELLLRLRWLAIISGRVQTSLGVTGGVRTATDAIKAVMAGAHGVQVVSTLLQNGPGYLRTMRLELEQWLEEHEYDSLRQMQGSMSLLRCDNPKAYERANYIRILQAFH